MGRVQLYCPSTNKTIDDFVIGAFQQPEQVLQGVRLAFDIKHAELYTIEAKRISDPHSLQEDQRVLVAASKDEKMLPDAPYSYVRYDGEETGDIDQDIEGYGLDWQDLTDVEKRLHITCLAASKPTTRNKLRVTRDYSAVRAELLSIQQCDLSTTASEKNNNSNSTTTISTTTTTAQHEDLIQDRWGIQLEQFLRQVNIPAPAPAATAAAATTTNSMKYPSYGTKSPATSSSSSSASVAVTPSCLTPATIAALAVLASLSHGQARLVAEVLSEAVAMRLGRRGQEEKEEEVVVGLKEQDVRVAVEVLFERAGVVPGNLTVGKKTRKRAKGRAARKAGSGGA